MITYFDASALAKRYVEEDQSTEVVRRLETSTAAASRLSEVEIASALHRRRREGSVTRAAVDRALATLDGDLQAVHVVELTLEVLGAARRALSRHPLRAADAIQLGSALILRDRLQTPIAFLTFDERLAEAAEEEGLPRPIELG